MTSSACSYTKTRDGVSTIHKDAIGYYEFFAKVSDDTAVDATKKVATMLKIESHYDAYQTDRSTDITAFMEGQRRLKSKEKNKALGEKQGLSIQTLNRDGVSTIHKDAIGYYEFFAKVSDDTTVDATKKVATMLKIESHYHAYQTDRSTDITALGLGLGLGLVVLLRPRLPCCHD